MTQIQTRAHQSEDFDASPAPALATDISPGQADKGLAPGKRNYKFGGLIGGVLFAIALFLILPDSLAYEVRVTAAVAVLMGSWWITEAAPMAATAMLPLVLFPAFGTTGLSDVATAYASSTILLFLGGFILALALQRWNMHKRIAVAIVLFIGTSPTRLIAGFMISTGLLSMWVSNTATAMMMIPMGMTVVRMLEAKDIIPKKSKFGTGLALAIAYSATIGGFGTLIGSPVNVVVAGYIRETLNYPLTFLQWMMLGVPVVVVFLAVGYFLIAHVLWRPEVKEIPGGRQIFEDQRTALGPMGSGEKVVTAIFIATASAWVFVPMFAPEGFWLSDTAIALIAAVAVMSLPARPRAGVMVMSWKDTQEMPWDVLLLIGGGLALSAQITDSGLAGALGDALTVLSGAPLWLLMLALTVMLLCLTELTSTTATVAAFVPVVGGLAMAIGLDPVPLVVAAALACTCAFMLPMGTPPNALAYSTGSVTMNQLMRTGIWMNLASVALVMLVSLTMVPVIFG